MRKQYTLKTPRFDPYKNIYVDVDGMRKICSKCGSRKLLNYENYGKDSQKEYGYSSQCRECKRTNTNKCNEENVKC